eukprot:7393265-Ditylum_brightwellii.AAC.1
MEWRNKYCFKYHNQTQCQWKMLYTLNHELFGSPCFVWRFFKFIVEVAAWHVPDLVVLLCQ